MALSDVQLEQTLRDWQLPGLSVTSFTRNELRSHALGYRDVEEQLPVTPDTVFPIASVTKTFTAEAIAAAVESGSFAWDDRIKDLIPGFQLHDARAGEQMTVRDAACHRSGLPPHTWAWVFGDCSRETFMSERLPHLAHHQPHDSAHCYSNILYGLLGQLLEVRTGRSWEATLDRNYLRTLDLEHTGFLDEHWSSASPDLAQPYTNGSRIPYFAASRQHPIAPASEMIASTSDLARWGQYLLSLTTDRLPWTEHVPIRTNRDQQDQGPLFYGLGWRIERFQNRKHVWHSGHCSGYTTLLSLQPETGNGIAIACNSSSAIKALYRIAYRHYDRNAVNWNEIYPAPTPQRRTSDSKRSSEGSTPGPVTPGLYHNAGYGDFAILRRGNSWYGKFQNSAPTLLQWTAPTTAKWTMPVYDVNFDLNWNESGQNFSVWFERKVAPITFSLKT